MSHLPIQGTNETIIRSSLTEKRDSLENSSENACTGKTGFKEVHKKILQRLLLRLKEWLLSAKKKKIIIYVYKDRVNNGSPRDRHCSIRSVIRMQINSES